VHCNTAAKGCRQSDSQVIERQPVGRWIVDPPTKKNGRKAMYIGIGGLILLIILLMILL
jgi:hypothetical protein